MLGWHQIALLTLAYLLGGVSPGYLLVRWRTGLDVRTTGSGGTGATNVGRLLGRPGYAAVFVLDISKGAFIGWLARHYAVTEAWAYAAAFTVVLGHVFPVWLGFRGGKGVGPFVGAWLVLAPFALIPSLILGLVFLAWLRKFSIAGLFGLFVLPAAAWWVTDSRAAVVNACATISLLLWSHRRNLRTFAEERLRAAEAPAPQAPTHSP
ncbi:MAG TPA: glycerol-3-phosphate acyltransferase [Opitutaceae bacterium]|nr:glycerol-3-phosphate acyltransferase [Opitutaceae bacterium]